MAAPRLEKAGDRETMYRGDKESLRVMPEAPSTCTVASPATWRTGGSSRGGTPPAPRGIRRGQQGQHFRPSRTQSRLYDRELASSGRRTGDPDKVLILGSLFAGRAANERDLDLGRGAGSRLGSGGTRLRVLLDRPSNSGRWRVSPCFGLDGDCALLLCGGMPMQGVPVI